MLLAFSKRQKHVFVSEDHVTFDSFVLSVRRKFLLPDSVTVQFVLNDDGCQIDKQDLANIVDANETVMVLCGEDQKWTKVCMYLLNVYAKHALMSC
jgi:hypothetical protein